MDFQRWVSLVRQAGGNPNLADQAWLQQQFQFGTAPVDVARAINSGTYHRAPKALIDEKTAIGCSVAVLAVIAIFVLVYAYGIGQQNRGKASIASLQGTFCYAHLVEDDGPAYHDFVAIKFEVDGKCHLSTGDDKHGRLSWKDLEEDGSEQLQYDAGGIPYVESWDGGIRIEYERNPQNLNQIKSKLTVRKDSEQGSQDIILSRTDHLPVDYSDYEEIVERVSQTMDTSKKWGKDY